MFDLISKKKQHLDNSIVKAYNKVRHLKDKPYLCHAPFSNIYFNIRGEAAPCWLTLTDADKYPQKSIRDIWFGEKFQTLRQKIKEQDLSYKCKTCKHNLENGNYVSVLSKLYDNPYPLIEYPTQMEFELSNICNLECVMCKGELSSTIRKNRENLPPIVTPYDAAFVDQLEEFIPHLKEAKFLGGEPFLMDVYFDIWDRMIDINPDIKIHITTNGSVWNKRVERILEKLTCHVTLSLDSVVKETYESIRIHANFDKVMENFYKFLNYSREKGVWYGMSVNPMQQNWWEMPDYVKFCNEHDVPVWFNTVMYPHKNAMWTMPPVDLKEAYDEMSKHITLPRNNASDSTYNNNTTNYTNLVENQVKAWLHEAEEKETKKQELSAGELNEKAETLFMRNLFDYIFNDHYLTEGYKRNCIDMYKQKLTAIQSTLNEQGIEKQQLYQLLFLQPISIVVSELDNNSATVLAEKLLSEIKE